MQPYIFFSLIAAILMAINLLLIKYVIKTTIKSLSAYLFYFQLLHMLAVPLLILFVPINFLSPGVFYVFLASVAWMVATITIMSALRRLDASVVGSLLPMKLLFVPFVSAIIINEVFSTSVYIWFIPLIIGGFIVSLDERMKLSSFFQKDVGL